jgi:hypothetical protein
MKGYCYGNSMVSGSYGENPETDKGKYKACGFCN